MARQFQIPGGAFVNEAAARQWQIPGSGFINDLTAGGNVTVSPSSGAITITGNQPLITQSVPGETLIDPTSGAVTITGNAPTVTQFWNTVRDNGVWTWFTDPRVVRYNGKYYAGWVSNTGDIGISKYDPSNGTATHFVLWASAASDDHNNAAIFVRPDNGKLMAFYCSHGDTNIRYRTSTNAEDISAWGAEQRLGAGAGITLPVSYSNPHYLSAAGTLFNHYRSLGGSGSEATETNLIATTDFGATWSSELTIFQCAAPSTPYVKSFNNGVDRIDFLATNDTPNLAATSVYHFYAQWDGGTSALKYYDSGGTEITSLPVSSSSATLIYDGSTNRGWIWDIVLDVDGHPHVLFQKTISTTDIRLMYSRWTGSSWTTPTQVVAMGAPLFADQPHYGAGGTFDGNTPYRVYASVGGATTDSVREIQQFETSNQGATWSKARDLTTSSATGTKSGRPYSPRRHDGNPAVFWWHGTYTNFTTYDVDILAALGPVDVLPASGGITVTGNVPQITQSIFATISSSGELAAQAATVAGTADRVVTASGALTAQSSIVVGTATRTGPTIGVGALQAGPATINGTAIRTVTASGSLLASSATVTGSASVPGKVTLTQADLDAIAAAVWDDVMEDSVTARKFMRAFAAFLANDAEGFGTPLESFRSRDGAKVRATSTVDALGARTVNLLDLD